MNMSKILVVSSLTACSLFAHGLWINTFESIKKDKGYATVGIGWGHGVGIEDSIPSKKVLESFSLYTPDNKRIALKKPLTKVEKVLESDTLNIVQSNMALQKISLDKKSVQGTYSTELVTKPGHLTRYINKEGKIKFQRKTKDNIKDIKTLIEAIESTTYAKSYFVFGKWSEPKTVGHKLEIIPSNDFSKLKIGDTIELTILYDGKLLQSGTITATSSEKLDSNAYTSSIRKGKAKFKLTHAGKWIFNTNKKEAGNITIAANASATLNIK